MKMLTRSENCEIELKKKIAAIKTVNLLFGYVVISFYIRVMHQCEKQKKTTMYDK